MRHRIRHMIYVERAASSTLATELASTSHITLVRNRGGSGELLGLRFTQLGLRCFFFAKSSSSHRGATLGFHRHRFFLLCRLRTRIACIAGLSGEEVDVLCSCTSSHGWKTGLPVGRCGGGGRRLGGRFAAHASHRPRREGREDHHRVEEERGRCAHQGYKDRPCEEAGTIWNICLSPCVTWF